MELTWGTGGIRAVMEEEDPQSNLQLVREITRGIILYRKEQYGQEDGTGVAVTFDFGGNREKYARETARVLALEGCQVWMYPKAVPTPVLSFAVRYLGCDLGIGISFGCDQEEYIEYRIYGADGVGITESEAEEISSYVWMEAAEVSGEIPAGFRMEKISLDHQPEIKMPSGEYRASLEKKRPVLGEDFDSLRERGEILWMEEQVLKAFLRAALGCCVRRKLAGDLKAVYTPLYGAGLCCVVSALRHMRVSQLDLVSEEVRPGEDLWNYSDLDLREPKNLIQGLLQCEEKGADLLLTTDFPGKRVGAAARRKEEYAVLTGDQTGVLLLDYLLRERDRKGTLPQRPMILRSVISTEMADRIAREYEAEVILTPPGFCYMGRAVSCLEEQGEDSRFVFAFEENHSYLAGTYAREPEPVGICGLLCEMADAYKMEGKTLWDRLEELQEQYGRFETSRYAYQVPEEEKQLKMDQIRYGLQVNPDIKFWGRRVVRYRDYLEEETWFPEDLLELWLEDEARVVICPSWESPELTVYEERNFFLLKPEFQEEAEKEDMWEGNVVQA